MHPINRNRVVTEFTEPSMTKQAPAQEVDINYIVNRYLKNGQMPQPATQPVFMDVPSLDLMDAMQIVQDAEEGFASLDSQVRAAFNNNPVELLRALEDPSQRDWLEELGLIDRREIVSPAGSTEPVGGSGGEPEG